MPVQRAWMKPTEFVMNAGWATSPRKADPNRDVAEACAAALVKTAAAKQTGVVSADLRWHSIAASACSTRPSSGV